MTTASPRAVRTADAPDGPLVGDGRVRRVTPFLIKAIISLIVAIPAMSLTRPVFAVAGIALAIAAPMMVGTL
jgi:hypothetical protein